MSNQEREFLKKLRSAFVQEAQEQVQTMSARLLQLEKASSSLEEASLIEDIFREVHNLKGSARAVRLESIESICHSLETVFAAIRRKELPLSVGLLDVLHRAVDGIGSLLSQVNGDEDVSIPGDLALATGELRSLASRVEADPDAGGVTAPSRPSPDRSATLETVRISATKLDALLLQAEEMLSIKAVVRQSASNLLELGSLTEPWNKEWTKINPELRSARKLLERGDGASASAQLAPTWNKLLDFLDWNHTYVTSLSNQLNSSSKQAAADFRHTNLTVNTFLEDTKRLLMMPCSTLFEMFPKLVRDLSREMGKDVDFSIRGGEIELDRRILAAIRDPLVHLLRNAIDHGIETTQARLECRKPQRATLTLSVSQVEGNMIEVVVSDDGAGINLDKVKSSAIKNGLLTAAEAERLSKQDIISFIFYSSLSTSSIITEISGRGMGMTIVRDNIARLGGRIMVDTVPGKGTTFRMLLPITIATFRGIVIKSAGQIFVIPTVNMERVIRIKTSEVKTVENKDTISLLGRIVPVVRLDDVLQLPKDQSSAQDSGFMIVIVAASGDTSMAFVVDEVLEEQEVLVKKFAKPLLRVRNIAGVTILGSGKVAPILNVSDLLRSATRLSASASKAISGAPATRKKQILVVDDTLTARMLIRNILGAAGYQITTANDGVEALETLRQDHFDLIVSDIEMPRMNGFDLTTSIRKDEKLADLPVVLLTARASQEDREHGVEAGANAYFVKSSFDQNNLLDVIRKLV